MLTFFVLSITLSSTHPGKNVPTLNLPLRKCSTPQYTHHEPSTKMYSAFFTQIAELPMLSQIAERPHRKHITE